MAFPNTQRASVHTPGLRAWHTGRVGPTRHSLLAPGGPTASPHPRLTPTPGPEICRPFPRSNRLLTDLRSIPAESRLYLERLKDWLEAADGGSRGKWGKYGVGGPPVKPANH